LRKNLEKNLERKICEENKSISPHEQTTIIPSACLFIYLCDAHAFGVGAILNAQRRMHGVAGADQNVLDAGLDQHLVDDDDDEGSAIPPMSGVRGKQIIGREKSSLFR
jgi:hypothetical protein